MNEEQLNLKIRNVLFKRAEGIQPNAEGFELVKERLSKREGNVEIMKRYCEKMNYKMRRPIISVCCFALVFALLCAFNPAVRVWAQEGVHKITGMIYVVVKGEDGSYQAKQVEAEDTTTKEGAPIVEVSEKDLGFKYQAPVTIAGNYSAGETISGSSSGSSCSLFYRNGDSSLVLQMTNEDWMMGYAETGGDNRKELDIEGVNVYYFEDPLPTYPLVQSSDGLWTNDLTLPPTKIETTLNFTWENEGVSYRLTDLGKNISYDIMNQAVAEIIKYQLDK
jgi:hypothetical protein